MSRSLDFTACNLPCEHPCWRRLTKEEIEWLEKNPNRQYYTLVCIEKQAKEVADNKIQANEDSSDTWFHPFKDDEDDSDTWFHPFKD